MSFFLLFVLSVVYANPTLKWHSAVVKEKHDFYQNYEVIIRPENTWQLLFSIEYKDSQFRDKKDCIFYRVPGEKDGVLKLKTVELSKRCHDFIFSSGDQEWNDLRAVQYAIEEHRLVLQITAKNYELETWDVPMMSIFKHPSPKLNMSSAEFRAPKIIFLRPSSTDQRIKLNENPKLKEGEKCHSISEDCHEMTPSNCMQCPHGWFETPNGCPQSPKYCGVHLCGLKNRPACRRGNHFTGVEKKSDCRTDSSFAYCAKGLMVQCQGNLAYCI